MSNLNKIVVRLLNITLVRKLSKLKDSIYIAIASVISVLIKAVMPNRVIVYIREKLQVVLPLTYQKRNIRINVNSKYEWGMRVHSAEREPDTVKWIETVVTKGSVFYDIGANVGTYSLIAALNKDKDIKIYSFEPSFTNFYQLAKNISVNNCEECIFPLNIAVSELSSVDYFNYNSLETGTAVHAFGEPIDSQGEKFTPVMRQLLFSLSIDELVYKYNIPIPNHLKIDVDGIEEKILVGASKVLESEQVKSVLIEINESDNEKKIIELMESKGLKFVSKRVVDNGIAGNYIFVRESIEG